MPFIRETPDGIAIKIRVQPRSSVNKLAGIYGDALKINLTAPPVDGAANKRCLQFLAKTLGCSKSALEILAGHKSRTKTILLPYQAPAPSRTLIADLKKKIRTRLNPSIIA